MPRFRLIEPMNSLHEFRIFTDTSYVDYTVGDISDPVNTTYLVDNGKPFDAIDSLAFWRDMGLLCTRDSKQNITVSDQWLVTWPYQRLVSVPDRDGIQFAMHGVTYSYQDANGSVLYSNSAEFLIPSLIYHVGPHDRTAYEAELDRLCGQPLGHWENVGFNFFRAGDIYTFLLGFTGVSDTHFHSVMCENQIFL